MSESNFEKIVRILSNDPMTARQVTECLFPKISGERFEHLKNKTLERLNRYSKQGYLLKTERRRSDKRVEYLFRLKEAVE